ncbi:MAG: hypothetical protein QXP58_08555 [Thermoprotei archaeon]
MSAQSAHPILHRWNKESVGNELGNQERGSAPTQEGEKPGYAEAGAIGITEPLIEIWIGLKENHRLERK